MELSETLAHQMTTAIMFAFPETGSGSKLTCVDMCIPIWSVVVIWVSRRSMNHYRFDYFRDNVGLWGWARGGCSATFVAEMCSLYPYSKVVFWAYDSSTCRVLWALELRPGRLQQPLLLQLHISQPTCRQGSRINTQVVSKVRLGPFPPGIVTEKTMPIKGVMDRWCPCYTTIFNVSRNVT